MPKKLQSDDDDLIKIFEHYAELRREHTECQDTVHTLECDIASLRGRVDELQELNKQLPEERELASPMQSDTCAVGLRSTNGMKYLRCRCLSPSATAMALARGQRTASPSSPPRSGTSGDEKKMKILSHYGDVSGLG